MRLVLEKDLDIDEVAINEFAKENIVRNNLQARIQLKLVESTAQFFQCCPPDQKYINLFYIIDLHVFKDFWRLFATLLFILVRKSAWLEKSGKRPDQFHLQKAAILKVSPKVENLNLFKK